MHEFTHLDLFSGIGGFSLAAQRAGFKTIGFSEVEPYACRVLAERFPGVPNIGDVRKLDSFAGLGRVTVLTGGYPCQPFSLAGKRGGADDDRHLWPAMREVIDSVRPSWVIGENVFGHVSMGLDSVLSDLESLGYSSQPFIIPACGVDARHKRERVWIVANAGCGRFGREGSREAERSRRGETVGAGKALADTARVQQGREEQRAERQRAGTGGESVAIPDADCNAIRDKSKPVAGREGSAVTGHDCANVADAVTTGSEECEECDAPAVTDQSGQHTGRTDAGWREWLPESGVRRVADGIPDRVDRLKGLGNSIVPQVVEPFFHWIRQIETGEINDATFLP